MISFYLLWTGCYFVSLCWIAKKWPNQSPKSDFIEDLPSITLLVPVRNEIGNVRTLASEIHKIDYPRLQVLLIDDGSEDGTFSFLEEKTKQGDRIKVLRSPGIGKKSALEFGVANAETALILCSDADCRFPKDWIKNMLAPFSDPKIQLVCGPVITADQDTFFQRFQQIEWASILLMTQYFFCKKQPLMCSGANLAYRKSAFLAVKGYEGNLQHSSGDDEFLLKKVCDEFGEESCMYLPFSENRVLTQPQPDFSHLVNQRVRWAGKWKAHRDWFHAVSAASSFLIQLVWLSSLILLGFGLPGILTFAIVWLGKVGAERIALGKVLGALGFHHSIFDFFKTGLAHPAYVLTVAVGALRGKFEWKGRNN